MLENKKDFIVGGKKKKLPTKLVALVVGVFGSAALIYATYNLVWDNSFKKDVGETVVEVRDKNTAYQGVSVNENDQAAAEAYCEDTKERINIQGSSRIIDTCVAKSVSSEWLSSMTSDEIEKMYNEQPSCIETGYDDEGYSCFTGYNQAGCNRGGQKEDGTLCVGYAQTDPVDILSGLKTADVCGLVTSCQSESEFDLQGFNKFDCDRQGKNRSGEQCPYEHITRLFTDGGKDQLGFFSDGFNSENCDIRGYSRQAEVCSMEDVTLVYGIDKKDQYGFFEDGYNDKNCNINGLNRSGEPCDIKDITRVFDPKTGRDQLGLDTDGYNDKNCHISGFNKAGELCAESDITRIVGKSGKDQRGIFGSGFNEFGCSASGVKKDGSMCTAEEIPNVFNPVSGKNTLGFFSSGFNDSGCSVSGFDASGNLCSLDEITRVFSPKTKKDQFGLLADGFNEYHCGLDGYDKNGKLCSIENMPLVINPKTGLNQFGLDKDMFAKNGCSITGFDKDGVRCSVKDIPRLYKDGYDQFAIARDGFNAANCNIDGLDRNGNVCALEDIPRVFDPVTGVDQFGLLVDGFTLEGCNLQEKRRDGTLCSLEETPRIFGKNGFDQNHKNKDGSVNPLGNAGATVVLANKKGLSSGLNTSNLDLNALKALGFTDGKYNAAGCDINGLNKQGGHCALSDITRVFDKETGRDQFELDPRGLNIFNCSLEGLRPDGSKCSDDQVTRIYNTDNKDQLGVGAADSPIAKAISKARGVSASLSSEAKKALGLGEDGYSLDTGCDIAGLKRDGTLCDYKDIPKVIDVSTGRDQFGFDSMGYNQNKCDINAKKPDGSACKPEEITELMSAFGENQFGELVNGLPKNNPFYAKYTSGSESIKDVAEAQTKLASDNIKNKGAIDNLTKAKKLALGLDDELFNDAGCGIDGLDRNGMVCDLSNIPRIFDPKTGLDQFGLTESGYNSAGCSYYGFRVDGSRCDIDDITRIVGKDGSDQFSSPLVSDLDTSLSQKQQKALSEVKSTGNLKNKFALQYLSPELIKELGLNENLRNAKGCGLDGLRVDGTLCDINDIPRVYDPVTGLDQFGLNRAGVNSLGCGLDGKRLDGSICPPDQVTKIFDAQNVNQFGDSLEPEEQIRKVISGLSGNIKNVGVLAKLTPKQFSALELDKNFRNKNGCGLDGLRSDGTMCDLQDITRIFDPETGLDQFGLDRAGKNSLGCDLKGLRKDGSKCAEGDITRLVDINNKSLDGRTLASESDVKALAASRVKNIANPDALEFLTAEKIAELGLDKNLRNAKGCGIDGLRADGSICSLEDTPRVFDPDTGLDQFGLSKNNRNIWGCDLEGLDRAGKRCAESNITKIFGSDGFDQRGVDGSGLTSSGLTLDGRNVFGCDVDGLKEGGEECESWEKISTFGVDGYDNKNKNRAGEDRFKLINGRNAFGCDVNGLKENGSICPLDEITRLFKDDGTDQFGLRRNNRNEFGCGLDGKREDGSLCALKNIPRIFGADNIDQLGLTAQGFNDTQCSIDGLKLDGSICPLNEIPRLFGDDHFDQFGIGEDGFNAKNCNLLGHDRQGKRCDLEDIPMIFGIDGLSQIGVTRDGFAQNGCSVAGVDRQGSRCAIEDIPRLYNAGGEDQFGVFADGFNASDCGINGFDRVGALCSQSDVPRVVIGDTDQLGFGNDGFNPETGCNLENKDKFGNSCHPKFAVKILDAAGADQFGLINGFNQYNCDLEGRKEDGTLCDIKDVTSVVDTETGRDQFGINTETGLAENGCGLDGQKADGTLCDPEDIPRITDIKGVDQLRLDDDGFSIDTGCDLLGYDKEGNQCSPEEIPFILGSDGLSHLGVNNLGVSPDGYNALGLDKQGCGRDNMTPAGKHCAKYLDLNIDVDDTAEIARLLKFQQASFKQYEALVVKGIGDGTISETDISYPKSGRDASFTASENISSATMIPVSQDQLNGDGGVEGNGVIEIPEGATMHVYVETPVNTDYTTTVWGEIVGGEYDGSKVRGTIVVPYINDAVMPRDKFKYTFNTLIKDRKSYNIEAVSMTFEDLGEFVEADNVDYHRIQRYGGLLTAAAFQALGASYLDSAEERTLIQQSELTEQATANLLGQNTRANTKENLSVATDQIADLAKQNFFRRPTIEKGATDLMIIFMAPVDNDELPVAYMDVR